MSFLAQGLATNRTYWFRWAASNAAGRVWAPASRSFRTRGVPRVANGSVSGVTHQAATLSGTGIGGSVQIKVHAGLLWLQDLRVTGDIQLFDNRGGAALNGNAVDGNLKCKGNVPEPSGSGNRAASKEDQCSAL